MELTGEPQTQPSTIATPEQRLEHWRKFYSDQLDFKLQSPSRFAYQVAPLLNPKWRVLDIGCGNGRDTEFLARFSKEAIGIDSCREALQQATAERVLHNVTLEEIDATSPAAAIIYAKCNVAYLRFFLHAIDDKTQATLLKLLADFLQPPALLFIQARSVRDANSAAVYHRETYDGHYRRLLYMPSLHQELEDAGFVVDHAHESREARYGLENPLTIRVDAHRRTAV
jgi:trans-aconitate methyltransferase